MRNIAEFAGGVSSKQPCKVSPTLVLLSQSFLVNILLCVQDAELWDFSSCWMPDPATAVAAWISCGPVGPGSPGPVGGCTPGMGTAEQITFSPLRFSCLSHCSIVSLHYASCLCLKIYLQGVPKRIELLLMNYNSYKAIPITLTLLFFPSVCLTKKCMEDQEDSEC